MSINRTLRRHQTKPNSNDFGEEEMRIWYKNKDVLGIPGENIISDKQSQDEILEQILHELSNSKPIKMYLAQSVLNANLLVVNENDFERGAVLLRGMPGSGKSESAKLAVDFLGDSRINHFSIGEQLRAIATGQAESIYQDEVKTEVDKLRYNMPMDLEVVNGVLEEYLTTTRTDSLTVIDSYPRYPEQIGIFNDTMRKAGAKVLSIVQIDVPREVALERILKRGSRMEGAKVCVEHAQYRLDDYEQGHLVTTDMLSRNYDLHPIDGKPPVQHVATELSDILSKEITKIS